LVHLLRRGEGLIDTTGLIPEIEDYLISDRFIELVGMDIASPHFETGLFLSFEERGTSESYEHSIWQDDPHSLMEFSRLGPMTLIDEYIDIPLGMEVSRETLPQILDKGVHIVVSEFFLLGSVLADLVDERTDESVSSTIELLDEIRTAGGPMDKLLHPLEYSSDLLIEFGPISDDEDSRLSSEILTDPLREPDHRETLPASLRMPDDTSLFAS
jgi:hypothetical protein